MIIHHLLTGDEAAQLVARASAATDWVDGSVTSRADKHCMFLDRSSADGEFVISIVMAALSANAEFERKASPAKVTPPMLVRYCSGDYYGPHIDAPQMGDVRADLACTIFLNTGCYAGGELQVGGSSAILRSPGDAYLYSAGNVHEVTKVTDRARYVVVFWVQSTNPIFCRTWSE